MLCCKWAWSESGTSQEASPSTIGISLWHQTDWGDSQTFQRVWTKAGHKLQFQVRNISPFSWDQASMPPPDVIFNECWEKNDFYFDTTCWALLQLEHDILPLSLTLTSYTIGVDKATFNSYISETGPGPDVPLCVFLNIKSTIIDEVRTGSCKEEDALITDKHQFVQGSIRFAFKTSQLEMTCPKIPEPPGFALKKKQNGSQQYKIYKTQEKKNKIFKKFEHTSGINSQNLNHKKLTYQQSSSLAQEQHVSQHYLGHIKPELMVFDLNFLQSLYGSNKFGLKGFNHIRTSDETQSCISTYFRKFEPSYLTKSSSNLIDRNANCESDCSQNKGKTNKTATAYRQPKDYCKLEAQSAVAKQDEFSQSISLEKPYDRGAGTRRRLQAVCTITPQSSCVGSSNQQSRIKNHSVSTQSGLAEIPGNLQTQAASGCDGDFYGLTSDQNVFTHNICSPNNFWTVELTQTLTFNTILFIENYYDYMLTNYPDILTYQITVGSDRDGFLNPVCVSAGTITKGGWFPCGGTGQYISIISTQARIFFSEIKVYTQHAVQINALSPPVCPYCKPDFPQSRALLKEVVLIKSGPTYVKTGNNDFNPSMAVYLKAQIQVRTVILLGARDADLSSQTNTDIFVKNFNDAEQPCTHINNYNTYTESDCNNFSGNTVIVQRQDLGLRFAGFGILCGCNCASSSFAPAHFTEPFTDIFASGTSLSSIAEGVAVSVTFNLNTPDTVSSVCGSGDGFTFCGSRSTIITDLTKNLVITTYPYKKVTWSSTSTTGTLKLEKTIDKDVGSWQIQVKILLTTQPTVFRTQNITVTVSPKATVTKTSGVAETIPNQTLFATVGQTSGLSLPTTSQPSTFFILSQHSFKTEVTGNLLTVLSKDNPDQGKKYTVKMKSVPTDPNVATSFFNVTVEFAKGKDKSPEPKKQKEPKIIKSQLPLQAQDVTSSTDTTVETQSSIQTDYSGDTASQTNSKFECQLDETGEMVCGTDRKKKQGQAEPSFIIPEKPTMVISEINKYGVFYLTFSQQINFDSLINLSCGGFIDGVVSEKTDIKSARYQEPDQTTDPSCSAITSTGGKGGGRSPSYEGSARQTTKGDSMKDDFNRNKYLLNSTHLNLALLSGGDQDDSKQHFEWFVLKITETQIKVQVIFEYPNYISTDARSPDQLEIQLLQGSLQVFRTKDTRDNIDKPLRTEPKQVPSLLKRDKIASIAGLASKNLETVNTATVVGTYTMSIILNHIMARLYTMVNALQMTSATSRLNVSVPANVLLVTQKVNDIASFNLLPSDQILNYFFKWSPTIMPNVGFQSMGTYSTRLTLYLGSIFFVMVLICALSLFYGITYCCTELDQVLSRIHKKMKANYYWTGIIRLLIESFFDLSTGIMLSINDPRFDSASDIFDFVLTCLFALVAITAPLFSYLLLRKYDSQLDQAEFQESYGSLTEGYHTTGALGKSNTRKIIVWFLVRRMITAVVIVQMGDLTPWLLISANMYLALADAIINWTYLACLSRLDGIVATFNNFLVLILSYFPYLYAGLIPDPEARYQAGWIQASLLGFMMVINLSVCGYTVVIETMKEIRRVRIERHNLKVLQRLGYKVVVVGMAPWQIMARLFQLDWLCFDEVPRINVQIADQVREYKRWLSMQIEMLNRYFNAKVQTVLNQEMRLMALQRHNNQVVPNAQPESHKIVEAAGVNFGNRRVRIVKESQLVRDQEHHCNLSFGDIEIKSEQLGSFENDNFLVKSLEKEFEKNRKIPLKLAELELAEIYERNERSKKFIKELQKSPNSLRVIFED